MAGKAGPKSSSEESLSREVSTLSVIAQVYPYEPDSAPLPVAGLERFLEGVSTISSSTKPTDQQGLYMTSTSYLRGLW